MALYFCYTALFFCCWYADDFLEGKVPRGRCGGDAMVVGKLFFFAAISITDGMRMVWWEV